jgi:uncharacterized protein
MAPNSAATLLLTIACVCGNAHADNNFSDVDQSIVHGDYAKAQRLLEDMARRGDAEAMYRLANLYRAGSGIAQDLKASLHWYEQAAEMGHVPSQYMAGQCYERGIGTARNITQAANWYARAARAGDAKARQRLANLSDAPADLLQLMAIDDENHILEQLHDRDLTVADAQGQTLLMAAAAAGHARVVAQLIAAGAQPDRRDQAGRTALFYAAERGRDDALAALLAAGADCNAADRNGDTALHVAIAHHHPTSVALLTSRGADLNARNASGWTAAQLAQAKGTATNPEKVDSEPALDARARLAGLRKDRRFDGWPDLSVAAWTGDQELVGVLLGNVDVDAQDGSGQTALGRAVNQGRPKIVQMLLDAGARPDAPSPDVEPLLIVAIDGGFYTVANSLLRAGADANVRDGAGRFPLGLAAARDAADTVTRLLASGANPNLVDPRGRTALMLAAANNAGTALTVLLAQGAAADSIDSNQRSALWYAAGVCDPRQLTQLLTALRVYDANQRFSADADGMTPLHRAVGSHSASCVETLLSAGHDTKVASTSGSTPLHLAALQGELKIAQLLADAGAPLDARDANGDTALYLATKAHAFEMSQFLLQRGANARIRNNNAVSAYDLARRDAEPRWLNLFDAQAPSVLSLLGSNR